MYATVKIKFLEDFIENDKSLISFKLLFAFEEKKSYFFCEI